MTEYEVREYEFLLGAHNKTLNEFSLCLAKIDMLKRALIEADGILDLLRTDKNLIVMMCVESRHKSMVKVDDAHNYIKKTLQYIESVSVPHETSKINEQ